MTATPELEAPERQGSRALGILGAFLGAFSGALFTDLLLLVLPDEVGKLAALGNMVLVGWTACWGYRLMRGYRSMKFAQWTVRLTLFLAQPLAMVTVLTLASLYRRYGTLAVHADTLYLTFLRAADSLLDGSTLVAWAQLLFLSMVFARLGWGVLLKYIDPNWYSDPRRIAQSGGNGATFNMSPCWPLPPNENIPERFEVDKGKITVEGEQITAKGRWGKASTFSVREVAGVVLGTGSGFTVLYDKENRVLAKFGWSRKNAVLFGQYLLQRGVPFVTLGGQPVDTVSGQVELPRQFTVREGKLYLVLGWFGVILFSALGLVCLVFLEGGEKWYAALTIPLLALFVLLLFEYYNWRLEVDGTQVLCRTAFGKGTQFCLDEVEEVKLRPILGAWELRDREGKRLARVDQFMENAGLMMTYLKEYQTKKEGLIV